MRQVDSSGVHGVLRAYERRKLRSLLSRRPATVHPGTNAPALRGKQTSNHQWSHIKCLRPPHPNTNEAWPRACSRKLLSGPQCMPKRSATQRQPQSLASECSSAVTINRTRANPGSRTKQCKQRAVLRLAPRPNPSLLSLPHHPQQRRDTHPPAETDAMREPSAARRSRSRGWSLGGCCCRCCRCCLPVVVSAVESGH